MLVRVIRRRLWARLNFCIGGHFVKIGRCFEIFKNFENSKGSRIVFPYTCGYCGAACLILIVWGPFFWIEKAPPNEQQINTIWEFFWFTIFHHIKSAWFIIESRKLLKNICACKARAAAEAQASRFRQFKVGTRTRYEQKNLKWLEIQRQSDLEAAPGRKSSQGDGIDGQTTPKSSKIRKTRKSRKTAENLRIERFFDF